MSSEHFFSRWSRRKHEVRESEPPPEDAVPPQPEPETSEFASAAPSLQNDGTPIASPEADLSAEEIAALPSLEELTADTDISVFLRKGVPEILRNAALRRMWSLDPKIRDFVCEAREYAYDWNVPGGVPGSGPLSGTEDIRRMVARIVGGDASDPTLPDVAAVSAPSQDREQSSVSEASADAAAPQDAPALIVEEEREGRTANHDGDHDSGIDKPPCSAEAVPHRERGAAVPARTDDVAGPSTRRHGGAMPL